MWLSGRAVKTQLQIVLIRLFAVRMDIQLVLKMNFLKIFFLGKITNSMEKKKKKDLI